MTTIKQVAAHAGVSPSCVSKFLKNKNSVRDESRKRIESAVTTLNYIPSNIARSLRGGKSMTVKVIMPTITLPFFAAIFEYLHKPLHNMGYNLILQTMTEGEIFTPEDFFFTDGVVAPFLNNETEIQELTELLEKLEKPLILMHGFPEAIKNGCITCDIGSGMAEISRYLIENGKSRIAFVGGKRDNLSSRERFRGFSEIVPPGYRYSVLRHDFTMEWGYSAGQMMIDLGNHPDAVVCENDYIAAGVIKCMLTHGIQVPGDVWVTGFDDSYLGGLYTPSISSYRIPSKEMSESAAEMLIRAMKGDPLESRHFPGKLILRESSA
jgi:LacI family transcriptional regulator